jgi:hypothetical protein
MTFIPPAPDVANVLAQAVADELTQRGMLFDRCSDRPEGEVYQVTFDTIWSTKERSQDLSIQQHDNIRRWAVELGIKLARPFKLLTFPLECPRTLHEAAIGSTAGLCLRLVTDYHIGSDSLITRLDVGVQWIGAPVQHLLRKAKP